MSEIPTPQFLYRYKSEKSRKIENQHWNDKLLVFLDFKSQRTQRLHKSTLVRRRYLEIIHVIAKNYI